jgi:hypothetical protein
MIGNKKSLNKADTNIYNNAKISSAHAPYCSSEMELNRLAQSNSMEKSSPFGHHHAGDIIQLPLLSGDYYRFSSD